MTPKITTEEMEQVKAVLWLTWRKAEEQNRRCCFDTSNTHDACNLAGRLCCRHCSSPDVEPIEEIFSSPPFLPMHGLRAFNTEPDFYFCCTCEHHTMVDEVLYCVKCGVWFYVRELDEEIF